MISKKLLRKVKLLKNQMKEIETEYGGRKQLFDGDVYNSRKEKDVAQYLRISNEIRNLIEKELKSIEIECDYAKLNQKSIFGIDITPKNVKAQISELSMDINYLRGEILNLLWTE